MLKFSAKFLTLLTAMCVMCFCLCLGADGSGSLIINGDFEAFEVGGGATGFSVVSSTAVVTDEVAKDGAKSLKITHTSGADPAVNYSAPLQLNETYKITAYLKVDQSYLGDAQFNLRVAGYSNAYWGVRGTAAVNWESDWVTIETIVTMTVADAASRINLYASGTPTGLIFYIDSFSCVKLPPMVGMIAGGDFENFSVGTAPTGFSFAGATGVVTDEISATGSKSLKVSYTNTNDPAVNYNAALEANSTYVITAYVKVDSSFSGNVQINLRVAGYNNEYWDKRGTLNINQDAPFTKIESIVTMGNTVDATSRINIFGQQLPGLIFYIDDYTCIKLPEKTEPTSIDTFKIADVNQLPLVETNFVFDVTFNYSLNTATVLPDGVLLNGKTQGNITVEPDADDPSKVRIIGSGLKHSTIYTLSVTGWMDASARTVDHWIFKFKTVPKIYIGDKKLYQDNLLITDSTLTTGIIKGEITDMINFSGTTEWVSVILVLYNNGEMEDIEHVSAQLTSKEDGTTKISAEIEVQDATNRSLIMYVWDSVESGLTLSECLCLSNSK